MHVGLSAVSDRAVVRKVRVRNRSKGEKGRKRDRGRGINPFGFGSQIYMLST